MKKDKIACVVAVIVLVVSVIGSGFWISHTKQELQLEQQAVVEKQEQEKKEAVKAEKTWADNVKEVTGLDRNRVQTDIQIADDFFRTIFDWKGLEEYAKVRDYMIQEYQIAEDSPFLQEFFPKVEIVTDPAGNSYDVTDDGGAPLSMYFGNVSQREVIGISQEDTYSYMAEIVVTSDGTYQTADGTEKSVEGSGTCVIFYDVTADGKIQNLDGYTLSE